MPSSARGFTLIEVMVALMVVAIALPALLVSLYQQIDGTAYLRDKSLATMVAANKLEEVRILASRTGTLFEGKDSGVTEMVERDWYWWLASEETPMENFRRIEVIVADREDKRDTPLFSLVGFLAEEPEDAGDAQ